MLNLCRPVAALLCLGPLSALWFHSQRTRRSTHHLGSVISVHYRPRMGDYSVTRCSSFCCVLVSIGASDTGILPASHLIHATMGDLLIKRGTV